MKCGINRSGPRARPWAGVWSVCCERTNNQTQTCRPKEHGEAGTNPSSEAGLTPVLGTGRITAMHGLGRSQLLACTVRRRIRHSSRKKADLPEPRAQHGTVREAACVSDNIGGAKSLSDITPMSTAKKTMTTSLC